MKSTTLSSEQAAHLLLTINSLRNLALVSLQQGLISRHTHGYLLDDIDQSIEFINQSQR